MKDLKINYKFLILATLILVAGVMLRPLSILCDWHPNILTFFAGMGSFTFVYFFLVGFSSKDHSWLKITALAVGLIVFNFLIYRKCMDETFIIGSAGILSGLLLASISLLPRIKKWFCS